MQNASAIPFVLCMVFSILVIGGFVAALVATAMHKREQALDQIAIRFGGRVEPGDLVRFPQVRLQIHNYPAVLRYLNVGEDSTHTQLTVTWPGPKLRCELHPQTAFSGIRALLGMEDIIIGYPKFDAAYVITGNDKKTIRELLTPRVQHLIDQLADVSQQDVFSHSRIQVKWSGGSLTITKPTYLVSYESLERLVSFTAELFAEALGTSSEGIEYVSNITQPEAAEAYCQICGERLSGDLVRCPSCRTPHHRDCWEYFGGCSTYACGQKEYVCEGPA